jgi:hypothetical protein
VGYGWTWFQVVNVSTDGVPLEESSTPWTYQPTFSPFSNLWPNTTSYGAGVEWFMLRSNAPLPRGMDVSLRVEWGAYHNGLGVTPENAALLGFSEQPSVTRQAITVTGVVSV